MGPSSSASQLAPRPMRSVGMGDTYLSVEVPEDGMVIWGKGFEVDRVGRLPWLAKAEVRYWGPRHPWLRDPRSSTQMAPTDPVDTDGSRDAAGSP